MKKHYIIPELEVVKIQTQQMLAASVTDLNDLNSGIGSTEDFNLIPTDEEMPSGGGGDNVFL
jgi:hypothetical protein